jgi:hypothetical protein
VDAPTREAEVTRSWSSSRPSPGAGERNASRRRHSAPSEPPPVERELKGDAQLDDHGRLYAWAFELRKRGAPV